MFDDAKGFDHIYLAAGYTDLRCGLDRLVSKIENEFHLDPYSNSLFLFCGRRTDRIKAVVWEGSGFVLLYKRLETGKYQWPRTGAEALSLSEQQFRWLTEGLCIEPKKTIPKLYEPFFKSVKS